MRLILDENALPGLVSAYMSEYGRRDSTLLQPAAEMIASGQDNRKALRLIYEWKNRDRGRSRIEKNSDAEIKDAFKLAKLARTDRCAITVLTGLHGVAVPTASAVLTAIDETRYTVIDRLALKSLGAEQICTIDLFVSYVEICRQNATRLRMSLRDLDRSLWMGGKLIS